MNASHVRIFVVRPVLQFLAAAHPALRSEAAEDLLVGTAAQESHLTYLHQLGRGPALGLWQMEPATHDGLWTRYLLDPQHPRHTPGLAERVALLRCTGARDLERAVPVKDRGELGSAPEMVWNLAYACAMARVYYWHLSFRMPEAGDVPAMAAVWKRWYNTPAGGGTEAEFIRNWQRLVA